MTAPNPTLHPIDPRQRKELDDAVDLLNSAEELLVLLKETGKWERVLAQKDKIVELTARIEKMTGLGKGTLNVVKSDGSCTLDGVADLFRRNGFVVDPLSDAIKSVTATKDRARVEVRLVDPTRYAHVSSTQNSIRRHELGDIARSTDKRVQVRDNVQLLSNSVEFKLALQIEIVGSRGETYASIFREAYPGMDVCEEIRKTIALLFAQPLVKQVLTFNEGATMLLP